MSDIVIEFENRLEDHLDADRLHYSKHLFARIDKVVSFILTITGILVIAFVRPRWLGFLFFMFAVLEWFNLLSIRPIQIRLSFKNNPKFKEIYRLAFNEDGIHFKTVTMDS